MPRGPHCGAYYSNCAVIGHFTCQTAMSLGRSGCRIITRPFLSGRVGSGHETTFISAYCGLFSLYLLLGARPVTCDRDQTSFLPLLTYQSTSLNTRPPDLISKDMSNWKPASFITTLLDTYVRVHNIISLVPKPVWKIGLGTRLVHNEWTKPCSKHFWRHWCMYTMYRGTNILLNLPLLSHIVYVSVICRLYVFC